MNVRNDVKVVINGKEYTLCGYESGEYLQKVASYINMKWDELRLQEGYNSLDNDMKNLFLALNLTDDYYKMKQQWEELEASDEAKDKEIFDMKHEMIALQTKLESLEGKLKDVRKNYDKLQKENIRLEVELGHEKRFHDHKAAEDLDSSDGDGGQADPDSEGEKEAEETPGAGRKPGDTKNSNLHNKSNAKRRK